MSLYSLAAFASESPVLRPVPKFDPVKYSGDWYEVASIPQSFQKNCVCTRARYTMNPASGALRVLNTCNDFNPNGEVRKVRGVAMNFNHDYPAKLWVGFFWGLVWSQYWVVELGSDYDFAVVSDARGRSIWVLSRTPEMSPELYSEILMKLWSLGVDIDRIVTTRQDGCNYPN
ncbi:MAG: lipocalin family protein [Xanthomonadaceae bacterium]|nr:lipocalin family protein [Xanthomonadaceae bacterium]